MRLHQWARLFFSADSGAAAGGGASAAPGGSAPAASGSGEGSATAAPAPSSPAASPAIEQGATAAAFSESLKGDLGFPTAEESDADQGAEGEVASEPTIDPALLARANELGFTEVEVAAFGENLGAALTAFDRKILADAKRSAEEQAAAAATPQQAQQQPTPQPNKVPEAPIPGEVFEKWTAGLAAQLEEQGYAKEAAGVLAGSMKELGNHLAEHIAQQFSGPLTQLMRAENARVSKELDRRFEAAVEKLDADEFGTGDAGRDKQGKLYAARVKVLETAKALAAGLHSLGKPVPEIEQLVERAYHQLYATKIATKERAKIANKLDQRAGARGLRPAARKPSPAVPPAASDSRKAQEDQSVANVAAMLGQLGLGDQSAARS